MEKRNGGYCQQHVPLEESRIQHEKIRHWIIDATKTTMIRTTLGCIHQCGHLTRLCHWSANLPVGLSLRATSLLYELCNADSCAASERMRSWLCVQVAINSRPHSEAWLKQQADTVEDHAWITSIKITSPSRHPTQAPDIVGPFNFSSQQSMRIRWMQLQEDMDQAKQETINPAKIAINPGQLRWLDCYSYLPGSIFTLDEMQIMLFQHICRYLSVVRKVSDLMRRSQFREVFKS